MSNMSKITNLFHRVAVSPRPRNFSIEHGVACLVYTSYKSSICILQSEICLLSSALCPLTSLSIFRYALCASPVHLRCNHVQTGDECYQIGHHET